MKKAFLFLTLLICLQASAQETPTVTLVDFVKVKNGHHQEALYYYQQNWKLYREEALKRGAIQSYQLLSVTPDSTAAFDFMLMTVYRDSMQYNASEAAFAPIIKELRPTGPALLNSLQPADFRQNLYYKKATTVFAGQRDN